jgi:signal transduction histidine kinase
MKAATFSFRRWTLGAKLAATFSAVILLVVAIVSLSVMSGIRRTIEQDLRERGADATHNLARLSAELVLDDDLWGLYKVLRDVVVGGGDGENVVAYAAVVDGQGKVLAHSAPDQHPIGSLLEDPAVGERRAYRSGVDWAATGATPAVHHFASPVVVDGQQIATARVGISLRHLEPTIARMRRAVLALAMLLGALGALVGLLVSRRMTRPLSELGRAADRIAAGDLDEPSPVRWDERDEIGALAERFNLMATRLRDSQREATEAQARLVRSERLASVGECAGSLAHEIRNPLGAVVAAAKMLCAQTPQAETYDRERLAGVIADEARRLNVILSDFLVFARPRPPVRLPHSMNGVVADVIESMRLDELSAGKSIDARCGWEGAPCEMDRDQITQVLWNLVRNALEATPPGGQVTVATAQRDGSSAVEVADRGPGIPPDRQRCLFEPFQSSKRGGSGLGLAIAHRIVAAHGGAVAVDSRLGEGTRIIVTVPLRSAPADRGTNEAA